MNFDIDLDHRHIHTRPFIVKDCVVRACYQALKCVDSKNEYPAVIEDYILIDKQQMVAIRQNYASQREGRDRSSAWKVL